MERNYNNYHVTDHGLVYSYERNRWLKPSRQVMNGIETGYICQTLKVGDKSIRHYIHRLVATVYLENPDDKPCVNHLDGNRSNNAIHNLEWATISENVKHSFEKLGRNRSWGRSKGFVHTEATKDKMANAKKGIRHPKFKGFYCFKNLKNNKIYKAVTPAELKTQIGDKSNIVTISRKCKNPNIVNYWFEEIR